MSDTNEGDENKKEGSLGSEEFEFFFSFTKPLVLDLPTEEERSIAAAWVQKIEGEPETEQRLNYLKLLLFVLQRGRLSGIFKKQPPPGPLQPFPQGFSIIDMGNWMLDQDDAQTSGGGDAARVPYNIEISNDLREFVASQEVPNFGVQMYYAWSADEPIHKWSSFDENKFPQYILDKIKQLKESRSDDKSSVLKNGCYTKKKGCDLYLPDKYSKKKAVKSPQEIERAQGRSYHTYLGLVGQLGNFNDKCDDDPEKYQRLDPRKNKCPKRNPQRRCPTNEGEVSELPTEEEFDNLVGGLGGMTSQNRPCLCPYPCHHQSCPEYRRGGPQPYEEQKTPNGPCDHSYRSDDENLQPPAGKPMPRRPADPFQGPQVSCQENKMPRRLKDPCYDNEAYQAPPVQQPPSGVCQGAIAQGRSRDPCQGNDGGPISTMGRRPREPYQANDVCQASSMARRPRDPCQGNEVYQGSREPQYSVNTCQDPAALQAATQKRATSPTRPRINSPNRVGACAQDPSGPYSNQPAVCVCSSPPCTCPCPRSPSKFAGQIPMQQMPMQQMPMQHMPMQQMPMQQAAMSKCQMQQAQMQQAQMQQAQMQQAQMQQAQMQQAQMQQSQMPKCPVQQIQKPKCSMQQIPMQPIPTQQTPIQQIPTVASPRAQDKICKSASRTFSKSKPEIYDVEDSSKRTACKTGPRPGQPTPYTSDGSQPEVVHCYDASNPDPALTKSLGDKSSCLYNGAGGRFVNTDYKIACKRQQKIQATLQNQAEMPPRRELFGGSAKEPASPIPGPSWQQSPCPAPSVGFGGPEGPECSPPLSTHPVCENSPEDYYDQQDSDLQESSQECDNMDSSSPYAVPDEQPYNIQTQTCVKPMVQDELNPSNAPFAVASCAGRLADMLQILKSLKERTEAHREKCMAGGAQNLSRVSPQDASFQSNRTQGQSQCKESPEQVNYQPDQIDPKCMVDPRAPVRPPPGTCRTPQAYPTQMYSPIQKRVNQTYPMSAQNLASCQDEERATLNNFINAQDMQDEECDDDFDSSESYEDCSVEQQSSSVIPDTNKMQNASDCNNLVDAKMLEKFDSPNKYKAGWTSLLSYKGSPGSVSECNTSYIPTNIQKTFQRPFPKSQSPGSVQQACAPKEFQPQAQAPPAAAECTPRSSPDTTATDDSASYVTWYSGPVPMNDSTWRPPRIKKPVIPVPAEYYEQIIQQQMELQEVLQRDWKRCQKPNPEDFPGMDTLNNIAGNPFMEESLKARANPGYAPEMITSTPIKCRKPPNRGTNPSRRTPR